MKDENKDLQRTWWKEAVVYQIYPRSFCDSNGDGIGDLPGVISKLDYLCHLGVDVIWLCPVYASPNDDNGYDISNYEDIMAEFGTMADFDALLQAVHERGMRLIMDLVVNHSSDEHPWFEASRSSRDNPLRDWYYWRPGKDGREPNNWESIFGGSAWQYDETTDEYYLHLFSRKQPDLNWENPEVRSAVYAMMRFWLDKGVDGFRLDAINFLSKTPGLPDVPSNETLPYTNASDLYAFGPRLYEFLAEMKQQVLQHYDVFTVGETALADTGHAIEFAHETRGVMNLIHQFEHLHLDIELDRVLWVPHPLDIGELKRVLFRWQSELDGAAWNTQFFSNHDIPRAVSRFGDDQRFRVESAKVIAIVLLTLGGTPFIFQGEEIGMTNVAFSDIGSYRDIATINTYREHIESQGQTPAEVMPLVHRYSRDNARTPMQWDDSRQAGFTTGEPWLPVNPNYTRINVANDRARPDSIINFFRNLIQLRRERPVMVYGKFSEISAVPDEVLAYCRSLGDEKITILANFSPVSQVLHQLEQTPLTAGVVVACNYPVDSSVDDGKRLTLRPFEGRIYDTSGGGGRSVQE